MSKAKKPPKEAQGPPHTIHSPALDKLSLKQRAFVQAIATPGTDTFGNRVQSALKAGYGNSYASANKIGSRLSNKVYISAAIDEVFRKANLGIEVRASAIRSILEQPTTDVVQMDKDGNVTATTRMSNAKHIIGAISLLNKMDGTYSRSEAIGRAQGKLLEPILEDYTRRLRAELREAPTSTPPMDETQTTEHAEIVDTQGVDTQAQADAGSAGNAPTEISQG